MDALEEFRRRLEEARARLLRRVSTTAEELETLERRPAGSLTEDAPVELATTVLARIEGQEKHELDEIDAALARLAAGTYGVCEDCGGAIPVARLRAMPAVRFCLACQRRRERGAAGA